MIEPVRLLQDANAPDEAASLLRSLTAPSAPTMAKQAELGAHLAALAKPALVTTAAATTSSALWVKAALVAGTVGLAATWGVLHSSPSEPPPPAIAPPTQSALPLAPAPTSARAEASLPAPEPVHSAIPQSTGNVRSKGSARDDLAREEALLEQARRLSSSSPARALAILNHYQRSFPNGQLAAERMFLSVDVLTRLGDKKGAKRQADALTRAFPSSVYAAQIKARNQTD